MSGDFTGFTVLQVLPSLDVGGGARGRLETARAMGVAGGRGVVACAGGRMVPALERGGAIHRTLPLMTKDPVDMLLNARRLRRLIGAERVGLVHARSRAPAWSALLAAKRQRVPFVTTWHGVYSENLPGKRLYNSVMARGDRVIAISDFVAARVARDHRVGPDRLRTVPRGADLALFDPARITGERMARLAERWRLPDGARVVLLPARIVEWKGHLALVDALARVPHAEAVAVFVGDTGGRAAPTVARICARAAALGLAARLRFVGHCDDMPTAYALADIVVAPSLKPEPFGRVAVEAQAMRKLVIVSDAGGAAETVLHGETGWRVRPGDVGHLADAIEAGLSLGPDELAAFGDNARASVAARFSTARMQRATLDVYAELLGIARHRDGGTTVPDEAEAAPCVSW